VGGVASRPKLRQTVATSAIVQFAWPFRFMGPTALACAPFAGTYSDWLKFNSREAIAAFDSLQTLA